MICACRNDEAIQDQDFTLDIRISDDPQRLNPVFAFGSSIAREIYPYIFLQLLEYEPKTLELSPILATEIPEKVIHTFGAHAGLVSYTFDILEDAVWTDGSPIKGSDYLFTVKTIFHPGVKAPALKNALREVKDIILDEQNPKRFTIIMEQTNLLPLELVGSLEFYPEHNYDPNSVLASISYADIRNETMTDKLMADDGFANFAKQFNDVRFHEDNAMGSGPYELSAWETDQYVKLTKKDNWWGGNYPERTFLQNHPNELIFHIIPDEVTAITQMKSGQLDIMTLRNGENYKNLEEENPEFNFYTPQVTRFYFIAINNNSLKLDDKRVRRAISHLLDIDKFMDQMENGSAKRTIGPVLPFRKEYNSDLIPIGYDESKSASLLADAGWVDTNSDGTVDKEILGQKVEMVLDFYVTSGALGQRLALLLIEAGKKVGVGINVIQKTNNTIKVDHILTGDYDLHAMVNTVSLTEYQPYASWHSDNSYDGGSNWPRYSNSNADDLILQIQTEEDVEKRIILYKELQEQIYEDQPVVFLYSPVARIVCAPHLEPLVSVKRPGYFLQTSKISNTVFSEN